MALLLEWRYLTFMNKDKQNDDFYESVEMAAEVLMVVVSIALLAAIFL